MLAVIELVMFIIVNDIKLIRTYDRSMSYLS